MGQTAAKIGDHLQVKFLRRVINEGALLGKMLLLLHMLMLQQRFMSKEVLCLCMLEGNHSLQFTKFLFILFLIVRVQILREKLLVRPLSLLR